ncbi:ATP-binding cassette glutathione S-conjugate transporter [Hortaea werneckii]|nr:ATP-binding cassette glutathione S-conjugate transporter [Hortaea werneckii]
MRELQAGPRCHACCYPQDERLKDDQCSASDAKREVDSDILADIRVAAVSAVHFRPLFEPDAPPCEADRLAYHSASFKKSYKEIYGHCSKIALAGILKVDVALYFALFTVSGAHDFCSSTSNNMQQTAIVGRKMNVGPTNSSGPETWNPYLSFFLIGDLPSWTSERSCTRPPERHLTSFPLVLLRVPQHRLGHPHRTLHRFDQVGNLAFHRHELFVSATLYHTPFTEKANVVGLHQDRDRVRGQNTSLALQQALRPKHVVDDVSANVLVNCAKDIVQETCFLPSRQRNTSLAHLRLISIWQTGEVFNQCAGLDSSIVELRIPLVAEYNILAHTCVHNPRALSNICRCPTHHDLAPNFVEITKHGFEERRFASANSAKNTGQLAFVRAEVDIMKNVSVAVLIPGKSSGCSSGAVK